MDPDSEARLLELAGSVTSGTPVDWGKAEQLAPDKQEAMLIRSLRIIDQIAQVQQNDPADTPRPRGWRHLTILEHVGQGAFGDVYRAFDPSLDWQVALKLLYAPATLLSASLTHHLNEARLLAKVRHQNVVRVYGAELAEGHVGLWMEFIKGRTLEDLLESHVTFGDHEAAQIGQQLCRALAAVHAVGLVHRDIKARNVMREEGGRIVLMDFGAGADLRDHTEKSHEILAGTPLYLAPEIFDGAPPSVSADIYSLGVLLFHLVTGSYPVEGQTRAAVQQAQQRRERKYLRDLRPDLPEAFIRVVDRAIEYEPRSRYRTAGEFEAALANLSGQAPVMVSLAEGRENDRDPVRGWWRLALAATLLLAIIGTGGAMWWSATGKSSSHAQTQATAPLTSSTPPAPVAPVVSTAEYLATFHSFRSGQSMRLRQGARVAPGDRLFLEFEASQRSFVYVVNQDEHGEAYLLFPLPGYGPTNPLAPGTQRLPGDRNGEDVYWQVSSAGGREHFYVFASTERPVAFENLLASLPAPEIGKPVVSLPLPKEAVGVLRSVGGLTTGGSEHRASFQPKFPTLPLLSDERETTGGLWEREITFENPVK
jgi:serine/threonine-protein kinase